MKSINTVILLSAIYLALAPVVYATDSAGTIGLDKQPTYSAMTSAGLKFTNPGMNLLSSAVKVTLEGDFTTIDLLSDGSTVHLSRIANFWAEFGAESLQREGKYYPPQPPVGDDSKVSSFNIGLGKLSIEETQKIFSDLAKILKLDESKVLPWFSNRMWEAAPEGKASLSCSNHSTNPSAVVYIFRFGEAADPTPFKLSIRLSWPKPNRAEPPGAGQPATQPADKAPAKDQTSTPTPEDSPR